jgi:hypothetical protein
MVSYLALPQQFLGCTQSKTFYEFADDIMGKVSTGVIQNRIDNEVIGIQVLSSK